MSKPDVEPRPVVEKKPDGEIPDLTHRALRQRIRQQEILAELGVNALQGSSFDEMLNDTARLTAEGLEAEFCKVLEHIPAENRLLVRAGVGWDPGIVGVASVGADLESPAGFALRTGKAVISNHLENEERFRTPEMLRQHGIHRAINVILQGDGKPFGVLEVDSRSENEFSGQDVAFLQGAANVLGMAIERERHDRRLKAAIEHQNTLLNEMNHRVKNSLFMVVSLLNLQSRDAADVELKSQLDEAANRVAAIGKAHDQLSQSPKIERMDIGGYVKAICADLDASVAHCNVSTDTEAGIEIETARAVSVALIVNELIANAAKYAYKDRPTGDVWIKVFRSSERSVGISVRDEGIGLPDNFDPRKAKGLGMKIISSFLRQLDADLVIKRHTAGTEFLMTIPLENTESS